MSLGAVKTIKTVKTVINTIDKVDDVIDDVKANKRTGQVQPTDVFEKKPVAKPTAPVATAPVEDAAPTAPTKAVQKQTWFNAPARLVAKLSKPLARLVGKALTFGGGVAGTGTTALMLMRHSNPAGAKQYLDMVGLTGNVGPQSAALMMAGIFAAATVFTLAQGVSFLRAGKREA